MSTTRRKRAIAVALVALAVSSLLATVVATHRHREDRARVKDEYRAAALEAVHNAARRIEARLAEVLVVEQLAGELEAGDLTRPAAIESRLRAALADHPAISSIVLAYPPLQAPAFFERADDVAVHLAVVRREGVDFELAHYTVEQVADTRRGDISAWYREPLAADRPVWNTEPYFSPLSLRWWSGGYGVPFSYPGAEGRVEGVVYADLSLDQIRRELFAALREEMGAFPIEASHAFVVSPSGFFLSHLDSTVVERRHRLSDFDPRLEGIDALAALPLAADAEGRSVHLLADHLDEASGQPAWVFFSRLAESGWWLAIVLDQAEALRESRVAASLEKGRVHQAMASLMLLATILALALRVQRGDEWRLWGLSIGVALLAVAGICVLWFLHLEADADQNRRDIVVLQSAIAQKVRLEHLASQGDELILVPTGVYVQSIEFSSANDVTVTGYVWQRYADTLPEWVVPGEDEVGFVLPESEDTEVTRAYETREDGGVLIGWYFRAVLRQEFDYSHYPFDSEVVWLRLWHSRIGRGVALAPDLEAYDTLDPEALPGVETAAQGFVLEGWRVSRSFFSYRLNSYSTSFGLGVGHRSRVNFPELYFNVGLDRIFLNPFIGNFIPLLVVAFLLFGVLWTVRLEAESAQRLGFNSAAVLGFCAALFFVVIVAHTSLRESLAAQRIVYLETFYFVLYVAILGVAVNAIQIASPQASRWVRFGDNLVARLLFWPLVTLALLWITLASFG